MLKSALFTAWIAAFALCACTKEAAKGDPVVSVEPQRALLQEIVGDRHNVISLLANGANPETFDPTLKTRMALDDAMVYFTTGLLPFEERLADGTETEVVDCSQGIELIYGTHGHSHGHGDDHGDADGDDHGDAGHAQTGRMADPHIWASVRNARIMARTMTEGMCRLEPQDSAYYRANFRRMDARLDSLDRVFAAKLAGLDVDQRAFAVWHPSLSYFARDYGLQQISVGFENKEVSPAHIAHVTEEAREHNVRLLFFQAEFDSRQAEALNRAVGTKMLTINPMAYNWSAELDKITNALADTQKTNTK